MIFELNTVGWHISSVINIILLTFWALSVTWFPSSGLQCDLMEERPWLQFCEQYPKKKVYDRKKKGKKYYKFDKVDKN